MKLSPRNDIGHVLSRITHTGLIYSPIRKRLVENNKQEARVKGQREDPSDHSYAISGSSDKKL